MYHLKTKSKQKTKELQRNIAELNIEINRLSSLDKTQTPRYRYTIKLLNKFYDQLNTQ